MLPVKSHKTAILCLPTLDRAPKRGLALAISLVEGGTVRAAVLPQVDGLLTRHSGNNVNCEPPVQVGSQTCTPILAIREFRSVCDSVNRKWISLLQVAV
jgi:hypothetical protein